MKNLNLMISEEVYKGLVRVQAKTELESGERPTQAEVVEKALVEYGERVMEVGTVNRKEEKVKEVEKPKVKAEEVAKGVAGVKTGSELEVGGARVVGDLSVRGKENFLK